MLFFFIPCFFLHVLMQKVFDRCRPGAGFAVCTLREYAFQWVLWLALWECCRDVRGVRLGSGVGIFTGWGRCWRRVVERWYSACFSLCRRRTSSLCDLYSPRMWLGALLLVINNSWTVNNLGEGLHAEHGDRKIGFETTDFRLPIADAGLW
jgi:hypothetical protein